MHLVELSRAEHSGLKIDPDLAEASAARQHLIPVVASEFRKAAIQYPIVFAKHPETGRFGAYVLNGLEPEENLFWTGTKMDVAYVPLNIRRRPFFVGMADSPSGANDNVNIEILWNEGLMDLVYSVIISTGQIFNLVRLRNERESLNRAWRGNEN